MKKNYWIIAIFSALVMMSCASTKPQTAKLELVVNEELTLQHGADLFSCEYYVSHISGVEIALTPNECPTLDFDSVASRVAGYAGCNHYFCNYKLSDERGIIFTEPGATMMACPNMDMELAFLRAIASVRTYEATKEGLNLQNEEGDTVLTLLRKEQK
ncbi:MAG: META domain-containing protein [Paludibacteraceae bacterium]|nr:META domain-containing protein [Paludibacteraceae bacterium]MBO7234420.1 META domain-containing protein [Paludibacteraceae bacterium]MBO7259736.1 META domain-containing protein [Paludibacteraceae bacterium]